MIDYIEALIKLAIFGAIVLGVVALFGYNKLRQKLSLIHI